jgi:hypothetical protein
MPQKVRNNPRFRVKGVSQKKKNAQQLKFVEALDCKRILFRSRCSGTRASKLITGSIKTRSAQTVDAAIP